MLDSRRYMAQAGANSCQHYLYRFLASVNSINSRWFHANFQENEYQKKIYSYV